MKRLIFALVLSLLIIVIMTSSIYAANMDISAWNCSGPGTISLTQSGEDGIFFTYNLPDADYMGQWWTVRSIADYDETFNFDWEYNYSHSWHLVDARLIAYAKQPGGYEQTVTLYSVDDMVGWGPHSDNGSSNLNIKAGYEYGFRIYGWNYDFANYLQGSLLITAKDIATEIFAKINIKPGSYPNSINLKSKGVLPVAILTTDGIDATTINPESIELKGSLGSSLPVKWNMADMPEIWDSSLFKYVGDGDLDLILFYDTQELTGVLATYDNKAQFTGYTYGGVKIIGTDSIRIIIKKK